MNTIYNCIISDKRYDTKYVLGVLNSKLMHSIWKEIYPEKKDVFPRIKKEQLVDVPIACVTTEQQKPIIALVNKILSAKKQNQKTETTPWEHEIDHLVYKLYGLTEDEIKIVEQS